MTHKRSELVPKDIAPLLEQEFLIIFLSTIIISVIILVIFTYSLTKPIDNLIIATHVVAEGNLDYQINPQSNDEIGRLVDSFNAMIRKLKKSNEEGLKFFDIARLEKHKAELILESIADGVIVIDTDDRVAVFNPAAGQIFDIEPKKLLNKHVVHFLEKYRLHELGKDIHTLFHDKRKIFGKRKNDVITREIELTKPEKKYIKTTTAVLRNEEGNIAGTVTLIEDITHRKELDNLKSEFVSVVSHELRTPLTSIKGYAALLADGTLGNLNDRQKKSANIINQESDRLTDLINDILDLSKLESRRVSMHIEPIKILECLESSPALSLAAKKNIKVIKEIPQELRINADKNKLIQVFTNLIGNSVKFTNPGGNIRVSAEEKKEEIKISIRDTGIGIRKDHLPKIFDKFFQVESHLTRQQGGTGLGLAIIKEIINLHQGTIEVKSKYRKGTIIIIHLPKQGPVTKQESVTHGGAYAPLEKPATLPDQ